MITASLNDVRQEYASLAPVPEFRIPPQYVSVILHAFRPAEVDNELQYPDKDALGTVRILTKQGRTVTIVFYDSGKTAASFRINGVWCIRGGPYVPIERRSDRPSYDAEGLAICIVIRLIYEESQTDQRSPFLESFIDDLERSRGQRPAR
jgi:hypothetical protein